jgi:hypothetical protein
MSLFRATIIAANKFTAMKLKMLPWITAAAGLLLTGCSTVDSRIARNRDLFNTWPPGVQDKVVVGQIDIGFTPDQVRVALGEPDRVFTRTTGDGTSQVWSYRDRGPRFSFGVGVGMGSIGHRGGTFGGFGIGSDAGYRDDEKMGIVFDATGRVASIETRTVVR